MRYFLFSGDDYEEQGGMGDYTGAFDTLEEASRALLERDGSIGGWSTFGWAHLAAVVDGELRALFWAEPVYEATGPRTRRLAGINWLEK